MAARPPRYTLRTLLVLVAISAAGAWIYSFVPNIVTKAQLAGVRPGMTKDEVRSLLGEPIRVLENGVATTVPYQTEENWFWYYAVWGQEMDSPPTMEFRDGRVVSVRY
jgi:outer membrane protein assembly factor BamE (lipoprotein component of BamABCDE complex)